MRRFQAIIGLVALTIVGAQTLRHAYILWVEPRISVLDRYEPVKQEIAETKSLDELLTRYDDTRTKAQLARKSHPPHKDEDQWEYEQRLAELEPIKAEKQLEQAISAWEDHNRQLHELHFFWTAGVVLSIIGAVVFLRLQAWAGLSLCILGTLEMIWVTCPSFRTFGSPTEFDRLLFFKLVYSAVSFAMVLIGWVIASRTSPHENSGERRELNHRRPAIPPCV